MRADQLPLFPLHSVLFPGGELRLRIVEPRHVDLIRWCAREQRPFGVCLLLAGADARSPMLPAAVGTEARISDFCTLPDGLLGIDVRGGARFHVRCARIRDNGLIIGEVDRGPEPPEQPVRAEHGLLVTLLEHLLDQPGDHQRDAPRVCLDCADWVGFRLAERLPFATTERQQLLQYRDPHARLDRIIQRLSDISGAG